VTPRRSSAADAVRPARRFASQSQTSRWVRPPVRSTWRHWTATVMLPLSGCSSCCPTCPSVPGRCQCFCTGSPDPRQHPFGSGNSPVRPVIRERPAEGPVIVSRFPAAFRPPAFASRVILSRQGVGPSSRSAYRTQPRARTLTGFPRFPRTRCGRGGCLLYPEGGGTHPADKKSSTGACRSSAAQPLHPAQTTHQRGSR